MHVSGKFLVYFLILMAADLYSSPTSLYSSYDSYLNLLNQHPDTLGPSGNYLHGEIEIVRNPQQMQEIEINTGRKVGIVARDKYWIWLNDAVKFPNGSCGVYGRVLWTRSLNGIAGIAVMPVLANGKIVLNLNYRHATRSWEFELPRGVINENELPEAAAIRETKEETGMLVGQLDLLGEMAPDTGLTNTIVPIYLAKVIDQQTAEREASEAIAAILAFSLEEIKQGFRKGYLQVEINGKLRQAHLRDPFLAFAMLQLEIR